MSSQQTRIVVCGGRKLDDRALVNHILLGLDAMSGGLIQIAHGDAPGADSLADAWCKRNAVPVTVFPADWGRLGRPAGPIRNGQMLRSFKPHLVVAFPGVSGTHDCCSQAEGMGIPVVQANIHSRPSELWSEYLRKVAELRSRWQHGDKTEDSK